VLLRVLGPMEVTGAEGPVALGGAKPRALLATLAIASGTMCTSDVLIDALWGESPPASAPKLLQVYISGLRRALPAGMRIATLASGYALELDPGTIDAAEFGRLVADGRAARRARNPALAASILARALALWRGPAYADVRYEPFAQEETARLERLREAATLERFDAELEIGHHADVLAELDALLARDSTQESIARLAVLAAYRSLGPDAALERFAMVRNALRDELGVEPGQELVDLHDRIKHRDPALELAPGAALGSTVGRRLPAPLNPLVGRRRELAELRDLLARSAVRLVSLTGAGGSGKSRLALELARELGATFANGAVLVELGGLRDPDLVPATIARDLDLEPGRDATATLLDALEPRELLLVLDNLEHLRGAGPFLVRLLAAAPRLTILATTRVVLHLSGEHVYPVGPLADPDAVTLFEARARALDPDISIDAGAADIVARICRRVDNLPLAIELAAGRVRTLGLAAVDARLASRLSVLTRGPRDLPARQRTLRETLAWSVRLLKPREQDVLAGLAVFPGSFPLDAAEAVAAAGDVTLSALVDHHLVQVLELTGRRRFRLLETVRDYARAMLGTRRDAGESALVSWVLGIVTAAVPDYFSTPSASTYELLDIELDSLRAALRLAARDPDNTTELAIASRVWTYWWVRGYLAEGRAICDDILERRGVVPTEDGVRMCRAAASLAWSMGDVERADTVAQQALAAAQRIGHAPEQLSAHNLIGVVARGRHELDRAERHFGLAIALAESTGNPELANMYRMNLATVHLDLGRLAEAREGLEAALDYYAASSERGRGFGLTHLNLGQVEFEAGNLANAEAHFEAAAEALRAIGFTARVANALQGIAAVEARSGRAEQAARRLGSAAALIGETGWDAGDSPLEQAATADARQLLGNAVFERLFAAGRAADMT
jgi:predicted ATPase/DNA-binding SARP family transcriptional activator